eukprot:5823012-Alexandrium_andersonii.AAC.1
MNDTPVPVAPTRVPAASAPGATAPAPSASAASSSSAAPAVEGGKRHNADNGASALPRSRRARRQQGRD